MFSRHTCITYFVVFLSINLWLPTYKCEIKLSTQLPQSENWDSEKSTQVLLKKHLNTSFPIIRPGLDTFPLFIKENDVIIDKSLLIKYIFRMSGKATMITAPRKWGRTINIDMIRWFVSAERDSNGIQIPQEHTEAFQYFMKGKLSNGDEFEKPPLLSKFPDIIQEHCAKYTVVKIDFTEIKPSLAAKDRVYSYEMFLAGIQRLMQKIFKQHKYVERIIEKEIEQSKDDRDRYHHYKNLHKFREILHSNKSLPDDKLQDSIKDLCEILNTYEKKPILIFIDEFDGTIYDMYIQNNMDIPNASWISSWFFNFFYMISRILEFESILTGITDFAGGGICSAWNIASETSILIERIPYYGVQKYELRRLAEVFKVTKHNYTKLQERYDGYGTKESPIFNIWDIMMYLKTGTLQNYWYHSTSIGSTLMKLLRYFGFKHAIYTLIEKDDICFPIRRDEQMSKKDFEKLSERLRSEKSGYLNFVDVEDLMFILLRTGYLTIAKELSRYGHWCLVIPNLSVKAEILTELKMYQDNLLDANITLTKELGEELLKYLENDNKDISNELREKIGKFVEYENINKDFLKELEDNPDRYLGDLGFRSDEKKAGPLHGAFYRVLSFLKIQKLKNTGFEKTLTSNSELRTYEMSEEGLDLSFHTGIKGLIIGLEVGATAIKEVLAQASDQILLYHKKWKRLEAVKFIAIKYYRKKVQIATHAILGKDNIQSEVNKRNSTKTKTP